MVILNVDQNVLETEIFLRLRKKNNNLLKVKFVLLIGNKNFKPIVTKKDLVVVKEKFSNEVIFDKIKRFL